MPIRMRSKHMKKSWTTPSSRSHEKMPDGRESEKMEKMVKNKNGKNEEKMRKSESDKKWKNCCHLDNHLFSDSRPKGTGRD